MPQGLRVLEAGIARLEGQPKDQPPQALDVRRPFHAHVHGPGGERADPGLGSHVLPQHETQRHDGRREIRTVDGIRPRWVPGLPRQLNGLGVADRPARARAGRGIAREGQRHVNLGLPIGSGDGGPLCGQGGLQPMAEVVPLVGRRRTAV